MECGVLRHYIVLRLGHGADDAQLTIRNALFLKQYLKRLRTFNSLQSFQERVKKKLEQPDMNAVSCQEP